ncbi:MAG: glycogen synthase GlgA [Mariprofundaceae bacterium]|nr:glycogen synthase GlgA [Mariprofundaceae bacterium]
MSQLNVVFIVSEAAPLAKTGGLADVAGVLPQALRHLNHQVTVIMPYYRAYIDQLDTTITPTGESVEMWGDGCQRFCPLHHAEVDGLNFILVEQDDLYAREGIYGPAGGAYEDNLLRYVLFDRVALEAAARLPHKTDIIHCHDWQTGMIPVLLKTQYQHCPNIAQAKTVFTIHNLAYQGVFPPEWMSRLGLPTHHFHPDGFEFHGQINCMKAGIDQADAITTVSPTYAKEILTSEYGCELEGFLQNHARKLQGIVNGLDLLQWDPSTDDTLQVTYGVGKIAGKKKCKKSLQQACGLTVNEKIPVMTLISRLADQKGIDLLLANVTKWLERGYQLVVLGSGDARSEHDLHQWAKTHPTQMYFWRGFNETLARQIYAGGDIFLMPSRFEPCGLGQLMAMRYGNVPVVRATGGLSDTVTPYPEKGATGFHFQDATPEAFDVAVEEAVAVFRTPRTWAAIRTRALKRDSSWDASAKAYVHLYEALLAHA